MIVNYVDWFKGIVFLFQISIMLNSNLNYPGFLWKLPQSITVVFFLKSPVVVFLVLYVICNGRSLPPEPSAPPNNDAGLFLEALEVLGNIVGFIEWDNSDFEMSLQYIMCLIEKWFYLNCPKLSISWLS